MFRVVKYLNYTHEKYYRKKYVEDSASELLRDHGIGPCGTGALDLLLFYRELEKKG